MKSKKRNFTDCLDITINKVGWSQLFTGNDKAQCLQHFTISIADFVFL